MSYAAINGITLAGFLLFCAAVFFVLGKIFKNFKDENSGENIFHSFGGGFFLFGSMFGLFCAPELIEFFNLM